jgi:hypothetical protein
MREPSLGSMLKKTVQFLEQNISGMITFVNTDIDLQPWEHWGESTYISDTETEINLMALMRDMLNHASVPAVFGAAILDKYPDLLHNMYAMDKGMTYFLMGLPAWFPWPASVTAHIARSRLWQALDDQQRALDSLAEGKPIDPSWGDLDDVSPFILKRNEIYRGMRIPMTVTGL